MIRKKQLSYSSETSKEVSVNTFRTSNETGGLLWTQNFPISSFQKNLRYRCLFDAGVRRKPDDKM